MAAAGRLMAVQSSGREKETAAADKGDWVSPAAAQRVRAGGKELSGEKKILVFGKNTLQLAVFMGLHLLSPPSTPIDGSGVGVRWTQFG